MSSLCDVRLSIHPSIHMSVCPCTFQILVKYCFTLAKAKLLFQADQTCTSPYWFYTELWVKQGVTQCYQAFLFVS